MLEILPDFKGLYDMLWSEASYS